jgi:hypothetical protein
MVAQHEKLERASKEEEKGQGLFSLIRTDALQITLGI